MYHMSRTSFYLLLLCGLIVANTYLYNTIVAPPVLLVTIRSVGKGSVAIVRTPHNKTLLIDTGSDASILRALGEVLPPWERTIDTVVLTSEVANATGGLPELARKYHFSSLLRFGAEGSKKLEDTLSTLTAKPIPYGTVLSGPETSIVVIAPSAFRISYVTTSLLISSTTPVGTYSSDGYVFK